MTADPVARVVGYGILTWLIPFLVAFAFYGPEGELMAPLPLFKSSMVVIGAATGAVCLVLLFRRGAPSPGAGLLIGHVWLALNLALDVAVLLPMSGLPAGDYVIDVVLPYLTVPIMSLAVGSVAPKLERAHA